MYFANSQCCIYHRKSDPPHPFPPTAQLLDHLSKICVIFFDQVAKDVRSMFTFEKGPLVAELKVTWSKKGHTELL